MVKLCLPFIALATLSNAVNAFTLEDALFFEDFDGSEDVFASGKWVKSLNAKYANQPVMVKAPTKTTPGYENDCGVQLTQEMKHYGFSSKLSNPVEFTGEDLVIQYELKTEELLACGGAYIKLLRDAEHMNLEDLNNESPYSIMFGPDKCGTSSKVHFIVQHQNPVSKVWSEHHFNGDIKPKIDRGYHQYSLRIKNDSTFEISLDNKPIASGSLLRDLSPPINPSEEIDDPIDFKPADWVDVELISDPTAVKPEDWDESQPRKIPSADKVLIRYFLCIVRVYFFVSLDAVIIYPLCVSSVERCARSVGVCQVHERCRVPGSVPVHHSSHIVPEYSLTTLRRASLRIGTSPFLRESPIPRSPSPQTGTTKRYSTALRDAMYLVLNNHTFVVSQQRSNKSISLQHKCDFNFRS